MTPTLMDALRELSAKWRGYAAASVRRSDAIDYSCLADELDALVSAQGQDDKARLDWLALNGVAVRSVSNATRNLIVWQQFWPDTNGDTATNMRARIDEAMLAAAPPTGTKESAGGGG